MSAKKTTKKQQEREDHYRRICQELLLDTETVHKANQKKIQSGIRLLFWIPLIFLALVFLTDSEKVIFLVLWIASLFGIAAYLIYIEYTDFEAQEKVRKYVNEEGEITNLIGSEVEVFEENVEDLLDKIEEKKAENIKRIQKKIRFKRAPLKENRNEKKEDET